jgi:hypothetical protein
MMHSYTNLNELFSSVLFRNSLYDVFVGKMQIYKLYFGHCLASENLIFIIVGPSPNNSPLIIGEGIRVVKIKCHEAKRWQKYILASCVFAVTPFTSSPSVCY